MGTRLLTLLAQPEAWIGGLALVAFVALYILLRGTLRAGEQAGGAGPGIGYRDAMIATSVGCLVLIALGALAAMWVGVPWSLPLFGVGFGGLIVLVSRNRRFRHESPTLRRVVQFADAALTISLLAGVLVVGNVLAFRYAERPWDFTRDRAFSLASLTVRQLRDLKQPVTFTVFHGNSAVAARQRTRVHQLLDLFQAANPRRVRIEDVSRYGDPVRLDELIKRVPDVAITPGGGVVVELGAGAARTTRWPASPRCSRPRPATPPSNLPRASRARMF